ncbi:uncharacterized protein BX664DRAFT_320919 [Halteromyces radiatus]|uniref:uncharacterized protein n=1 Tax=Halteromyces radiatus TaxID=101107 RepID=UPI002220D503|nr:uncharacterized protein BX664DRAFT_320919 [Halteromyces radiatus]KAI8099284.1 hypothetical protein BX664DRAFT_320919 [Halteromyces radiatus]
MISVRLKLYEILDTEDKLVLLLSSPKQSHARLPTFVSDTSPFMIPEFGTCPFFAEELNFDLNDRSAVHLESNRLNSNSGDYQGPSLLLRPKKYYIHEPIDLLLQDMDEVNEYSRAIKKLGFESVDESVRFVTISLHCTDDDSDIILRRVNRDGDILEYERNATLIRLLGNMDKNIWILCYFNGNDKRLSRSSHYHKDYAFRVY